jgi:TRAP-type transport system periplasmic protein
VLIRIERQKRMHKTEVGDLKTFKLRGQSMKNITLLVVSVLFLASMLFAVNPAQGAAEKPIELKFAHFFPITNVMHKDVIAPWGKMLEERTGGRVKVVIYPMEQLVKLRDLYDAVLAGTADMSCGFFLGSPAKFDLAVNSICLPMIFPSATVGSKVYWDLYEKFPAFKAQFNDVKPLWFSTSTPLAISTSKKPVRTLEDIKGLRIRTGGGSVTQTLKAINAVPVTLSTGDAYVALERGTIDGTTIAIEGLIAFKLGEVLKHHTMIGLATAEFFTVMNKKKWESLPPDIQKTIDGMSGRWGSDFAGTAWDKDEEKAIDSLKKAGGHDFITISPEERDKWRKAVQPVWEEIVKGQESRGLPGREVLNEMLRLTGQSTKGR